MNEFGPLSSWSRGQTLFNWSNSILDLAMFMHLMRTRLDDSLPTAGSGLHPPLPPPEYIPPLGASINTWPNIVKNKETIDFCVDQFYHLMTRFGIDNIVWTFTIDTN
jgi:hypothetical protein